jgi:hypothetical protein
VCFILIIKTNKNRREKTMKKEKTYWYDLKPSDDNDGFIYGINYIDNDEIIECKWFKTKQERNKEMEVA